MKLSRLGLALPLFLAAVLSSEITSPPVGVVRLSDGSVHAVYGLPANFVVMKESLVSADAASFSDLGGVVSLNGNIRLLAKDHSVLASYASSESAPVLSIDHELSTALAWLPQHHVLLHWDGKSFTELDVEPTLLPGSVTSLHCSRTGVATLTTTSTAGDAFLATLSLKTGQVTSVESLPGARGAAFQQQSFVLFHDETGLEISSPGGIVQSLPIASADLQIERMSSNWLHIMSPGSQQHWALHVDGAHSQLSVLPVPSQAPMEASK